MRRKSKHCKNNDFWEVSVWWKKRKLSKIYGYCEVSVWLRRTKLSKIYGICEVLVWWIRRKFSKIYDFCVDFYKQYGLETKVIPVTTAEYGLSVAARPFNSRLEKKKLVEAGFSPLPTWQDAVSRYLKEAQL